MNEKLKKTLACMQLIRGLKDTRNLNPQTARLLLAVKHKEYPEKELQTLSTIMSLSQTPATPFPNPEADCAGPIVLAHGLNQKPIGMLPEECHVLLSGQTGVGKSTLLRLIFAQALNHGIKVWLFVRSEEMRSLLDIDKDILVFNFNESLKINPLNPNGIPIQDYCNVFLDIFIQSQKLYDGTKNFLLEQLNFLYQKHANSPGKYPGMFDLYNHVKFFPTKHLSRIAAYKDSALNRLGGMVFGTLGKVFDCAQGYEESLLGQSCIFEIDKLTAEQQIFFLNLMLTKLFFHRIQNPSEKWHFVAIDDGNLLFDASLEKRSDLGLPILHHLLSTVRKSRINVFCGTQTPHQIGASIHSNSAMKIMFSHTNGQDIDFLHRSLGIKDKDQKTFSYQLGKRQILIRNSFRYPTPVFGIVPEIPQPRFVSDIEATHNNSVITARFRDIVPRHQATPGEINKRHESNNQKEPKKESTKRNAEKSTSIEFSDQERDFLLAVHLNQYKKTLTEIYKLAGLPAGTGSRIAKKLEARGLIQILSPKLGRGNPRYPILAETAYEALNLPLKTFPGRGAGPEHVLFQHLISEHFMELKPTIELSRNGKSIDIGIQSEKGLIAIEVACSPDHEIENIQKDLKQANVVFVFTACKNQKILEAVERNLFQEAFSLSNRVKVLLVGDLLKPTPEQLLALAGVGA